jgi:hypothetical protein
MRTTRHGFLVGVLFSAFAVAAPSEAERIEAALKAIEGSKISFVRNGDEHNAKAAADHLRSKLKKAGKDVKTFDEFVEHLATKSSLSGKPYQVKLEDGTLVPLARWLREKDAAAVAAAAKK